MTLTPNDLEYLIALTGGRSSLQRGKPDGVYTAQHALELRDKLVAERDRRMEDV